MAIDARCKRSELACLMRMYARIDRRQTNNKGFTLRISCFHMKVKYLHSHNDFIYYI